MKKLWTWAKKAGGALVKGGAGWQVYAGMAAAVLVLVGVVLVWFNGRIDKAFEAGQKAVQVEQLAGAVQELQNVMNADKESNDAISKNLEQLGGMAARVDDLERMRRADAGRINQLVRSAPEPAVRANAEQAERDIATVERERDGFAQDAVRASTAAWGYHDTLQARRDALAAQRKALKPVKE